VSGSGYRECVFKDRGELARAVAEGLVALAVGRSRKRYEALGDGERRIAGADKHAMVARCREARALGDRPVPILGVSPAGELVWWLDEAASSGA